MAGPRSRPDQPISTQETELRLSQAGNSYEIVFDGGALGNPGKGYGSYVISHDGVDIRHHRHEFGDRITNNQAEYRTLIEALTWLGDSVGAGASASGVIVRGDSLLVLNQLMGKWKVKNEGLRPLYMAAAHQLRRFGKVDLVWHDRSNSVKRLGH